MPKTMVYGDTKNNPADFHVVLEYYKGDSLKCKAARFLIDNITTKFSYNNDETETILKNTREFLVSHVNEKSKVYRDYFDVNALFSGELTDNDKKYDNNVVTPKYLIKQIEDAFATRDKPWTANISFDLFCNYVLPYRIGNEPLSDWRSAYKARSQHLTDKFENVQSNKYYKLGLCHQFVEDSPLSLYIPKGEMVEYPLDMLPMLHLGNCKTIAYYNVALLRSAGISATVDYVPQWGNRSMGHSWGVVFMDDSTTLTFGRGESLGEHFNGRPDKKMPKVFRQTFLDNKVMLDIMSEAKETIPDLFRTTNIMDVTSSYTSTSDVEVRLYNKPEVLDRKWFFLSVFDNEDWVPVWFGENEDGRVKFSSMGRGIVYMPCYYDADGYMKAAANPFILNEDGTVDVIAPQINNLKSADLARKYPKSPNEKNNKYNLLGGVFLLSNDRDFKDSIVAGSIDSFGEECYCSIPVKTKKTFRYVKYKVPSDRSSKTAEITLYDKDGKRTVISSKWKATASKDIVRLIDGNVLTSCNMTRINGRSAVIELEEPTALSEIRVMPLNDGNYIEEGDSYSLFYWNNNDWVRADRKTATQMGHIQMKNIPDNALLLLHDETKGTEERLFILNNGQQLFY